MANQNGHGDGESRILNERGRETEAGEIQRLDNGLLTNSIFHSLWNHREQISFLGKWGV